MGAARRASLWLVGGLALTAANAWLVAFDVNQIDESWTLQVVERLLDGDDLYSDVWFGATPLSIYVLQAVAYVAGAQILVVKALVALAAAAGALLVARLGLQGGMTPFGAVVLGILTVPFSPAFPVALYTPLAVVFFLACESVALTEVTRPRSGWTWRLPVVAGALAGLSFAAKQNVGGLAAGALVATLLLTGPIGPALRRAGAAIGTFAGIAAMTVAAMIVTGGLRDALDALGLGKGEYLEYGAIPYHRALLDRLEPLTKPQTWLDQLTGRDRDVLVTMPKTVLPVVTAALLVAAWVAWRRRASRPRELEPRLVTVSVFAVASFFGAFPRYDAIHLAWIAGSLLVACGVALAVLVPRPAQVLRLPVAALAVAWALFVLGGPLGDWRDRPVTMDLPHFNAVHTTPQARTEAHETVRRLQDALAGRTAFLVIPPASFYYLAAGLENPTRYDFPSRDVIGDREIDDIVRGIRAGRVPAVCLVSEFVRGSETRPVELERRLRTILRAGLDVGPCRLWFPDGRR